MKKDRIVVSSKLESKPINKGSIKMKQLKLSQIKEICKIMDASPKEAIDLIESGEWSLYTEAEALETVTDYIRESCVYFNTWFLASACELSEVIFKAIQKAEDNEACLALIKKTCGLDVFVELAVSADGMGHFLSSYDGNEYEIGDLLLYRNN